MTHSNLPEIGTISAHVGLKPTCDVREASQHATTVRVAMIDRDIVTGSLPLKSQANGAALLSSAALAAWLETKFAVLNRVIGSRAGQFARSCCRKPLAAAP